MIQNLLHMDPGPQFPNITRMIVEIPKGSTHKYEYDKELGVFRLDRALYSPIHYPGDYGFIPGTLAEDGDPLDILVWVDQPTFCGCLLEVRPVGLLKMIDQREPDTKLFAVPQRDPRYDQIKDVEDVFPHVRREIEHFFTVYKDLEGKKTEISGWLGENAALEEARAARERYLKTRKTS